MVDLGNGRVLFALLRMANGMSSDDHLAIMSMKAMDPAYANNKKDSAQRIASGSGIISPAEVAPQDYPLLLTFTDIKDPTSVARVDPANLAASFGPGVRLKRIVVEVTDDDVTMGIEEQLPSPDPKGFFNWDGKSNVNDENVFSIMDFMRRQR